MFALAIWAGLPPPELPNVGTLQSLGPRDTCVLHSGSFSTFSFVRPKLLGRTAIVANKRRAGDAG
jgi:hypothetical protein